uniref:Apple domain-containing protein n=1 Tax=Elaeophora elaphi TaxID=1147741 RepID=A0A0R3RKH3_9BILA
MNTTNSSLNFRNDVGDNGNTTTYTDEIRMNITTNTYESNNDVDMTDTSVTSTINSTHSTLYATSSAYYDLSQEIEEGEEERQEEEGGEKEKSREISESQDHDLTTIQATTAILTNERFNNFITAIDSSSSESNNETAVLVETTPLEMDDAISNQTSKTTLPAEIIIYPNLGKCVYSAIYQTSFRGTKLIKRFLVSSPQQCFYGCHFEGCRSSNLIQVDNQTNFCELFSDALIDYRTSDVLVYDSGSVYFDGIKCNTKRRKVNDSSSNENENDDNSIHNEEYGDDNKR